MSGHRPFSKLRKRMMPARRDRNARVTQRKLANMTSRKGVKPAPARR